MEAGALAPVQAEIKQATCTRTHTCTRVVLVAPVSRKRSFYERIKRR